LGWRPVVLVGRLLPGNGGGAIVVVVVVEGWAVTAC
jgi:hypothetical protein